MRGDRNQRSSPEPGAGGSRATDQGDRALLERDRMTRGNQRGGELADAGLVADEGEAGASP